MRISDWSSDVCSSDLAAARRAAEAAPPSIAEQLLLEVERSAGAVAALRPTFRRGIGLEALQQALGALAVLQILEGRRGILQLILQHAFEVRLVRDIMPGAGHLDRHGDAGRSEEHTSELQSLMRNSYAVFCLKKKNT